MTESKFRQTLRKIYGEPYGITIIKGWWKTGKTNLGFKLYEILKDMGLISEAAGNVQTYKDQELTIKSADIKYFDNFVQMKAWMFKYSHLLYDRVPRRMFFFDEAMGNAPSKKAMTMLNAEWQRVIPELSKGKIHLVAITQEESMTEKIFLHPTFNVAKWEKISLPPTHPQYRKRVKVSSKLLKETLIFNNVSPCQTLYHPGRSATWSMEPKADFSTIENSLELRVALDYGRGKPLRVIQKEHEELLHPQQTKRVLRAGILTLFNMSQVTTASSGLQAGGDRDKTEKLKAY